MNDGLNARDLRMVNEQREGVADHRGAPQLAILLGCDAPRTDATAGRHHDGRYPSRHRIHSYFSMSRRWANFSMSRRWAKARGAADGRCTGLARLCPRRPTSLQQWHRWTAWAKAESKIVSKLQRLGRLCPPLYQRESVLW